MVLSGGTSLSGCRRRLQPRLASWTSRFRLTAAIAILSLCLFPSSEALSANKLIPIRIQLTGPDSKIVGDHLHHALDRAGIYHIEYGSVPGTIRLEAQSANNAVTARLLSIEGKVLMEHEYERGQPRLNAYQLADDLTLVLTGQSGVATSQIAFVVDHGHRKTLHLCDFDGRNVRDVPTKYPVVRNPAISPKGTRIAFLGGNGKANSLVLLDLRSHESRVVVPRQIAEGRIAWSPDGKLLAGIASPLTNPRAGSIFTVKSVGKSPEKQLFKGPAEPSNLSWSPDGKRLVFSVASSQSRSTIFTKPITTRREAASPIPLPVEKASSPNWSPDGNMLCFVAHEGLTRYICLYSFAANHVQKLGPGYDPVWGADSRHLVYSTGPELRVLNIRSNRSEILVTGKGRMIEPTWTR